MGQEGGYQVDKVTVSCKAAGYKQIFYQSFIPQHQMHRIHSKAGQVVHQLMVGGFKIEEGRDRKSTRLKSSHVRISYAVFCLKKKKKKQINRQEREIDT